MVGQVLGHCRVVAKIGEGGMGVVYRAHDEVLHRDVALKVVKKGVGLDSSGSQNLLREARASSGLSHPNICTIYEVGETDGELYIAMELVEGKTLHALCADTGMPSDAVLRYGVQMASALARAHDRGIVHRDFKSANILVTPEGLVKVLDFGLARQVGAQVFEASTASSFATIQDASSVSGTLHYMAPEIFRGEPSDHRSDLWALGVVLYEAASGKLPFEGRTGFEISSAILREQAKPLGPPVPPGLWSVIQRCLAKEPTQRYQRAGEVQAALEAVQSGAMGAPDPDRIAPPRTTILHNVKHVRVKKGDFVLLVGTTKGAFILKSNMQRKRWEVGGPYFHGYSVYSLAYDDRAGRHRIWASTQNYWGTLLRSTDDFGKCWRTPQEATIRFPADAGLSLKNIWQITPGHPDEPDTIYCGVEPAALFETRDDGETWSLVQGLFDHPHRPRWMPGNGGLALHTIVLDPKDKQRMYVAISSGGVYRTEDGGNTWTAQNRGIRAVQMPNPCPEFGQCVHKIAMHPERPERLFLQNHWGLYRSDDCAENWKDIANGVPSDFGFAMIMHPRNPECVYIVPVESDEFRCTCDGKLRVYRTRNAGASWEPLMRGLPQKGAYETVLREALVADSLEPLGLYLGTRSGQLFASRDEGKSWERISEGLPPVLCVRTALIGDAESGPSSSAKRKVVVPTSTRRIKGGSSRKSQRTKR